MHFTILIADFSSFHDRLGTKKKDRTRKPLKNSRYIAPLFIFHLFGVEINKEKLEIRNR